MTEGGIGFFDSGIGGLTVLAKCVERLDETVYYYYGDNARAPYGNLPEETIRRYVFEAFEEFARLNVRAVVLACNTATAVCLDDLRERYDFPIVGTEPAVLSAAPCGGEVLVLATRATVASKRIRSLMDKACRLYPSTRYRLTACDDLAGGIEKGVPFERLKNCLPLCDPTAIVLGCTHYSFVKNEIENYYQKPVFDGNVGVAQRLQKLLSADDFCNFSKNFIKNRDERPPKCIFAKKDEKPPTFGLSKNEPISLFVKTNKCSQNEGEMGQKQAKSDNFPQIFFLGSGAEINRKKCEQMFVVD